MFPRVASLLAISFAKKRIYFCTCGPMQVLALHAALHKHQADVTNCKFWSDFFSSEVWTNGDQ